MKKYPIELFEWEWYENDKKEKKQRENKLKDFIFEIPLDKKKTLKDVKEFVKDECIKAYDPVCPCFLLIYKQDDEDKKKNVLSINDKYKDDTLLDDTIFNEKYKIYVCVVEGRKCTCGKLDDYRTQVVLLKKAEDDKKEMMNAHKKELNEQANTFKNTISEQNKRLNETNRKIHDLETEARRAQYNKKQKKAKKKDANLRFLREKGKIIKEYYNNNSENIIYDFFEKMEKFIDEKISFENMNVSSIAQAEKFSKNIKNVFEEKIEVLNDNDLISKISHFNILVMGQTGAGKSTLLNKVLRAQLAKTFFGNICTQNIESYESPNAKGLRIYDTRGIENGKYNMYKALDDIKEKIYNLIQEKNPDEFIHCIWYCLRVGNRFSDEEFANICQCYDLYKIKKLPIILIFTQADNEIESETIINYAQSRINEISDNNLKDA
jgi:putative ribosome biogenesis GTPase RsgA